MNKLSTLTFLAGLITAATTLAPSAAVVIPKPTPSNSTPSTCSYDLGFMRTIRTDEISAIRNQPVALIPVCEDQTLTNDYGSLFIDGNAGSVRSPIAHNPLLMAALQASGYDHQDVVSIRFGANDSVLVYVHQRDMR